MKKTNYAIIATLILTTIILITSFAFHMRSSSKVLLGPIPAQTDFEHPWVRQTVVDMRNWVQTLKATDARMLNNKGKVVFSWAEFNASYPKEAGIIDDYQEQLRASFAEVFQKQGKAVPDRLATHHTLDTIGVERSDDGKYRITITSKEGMKQGSFDISEPK